MTKIDIDHTEAPEDASAALRAVAKAQGAVMGDQRNLMFHRDDFEKLVRGVLERDGVGLVLTSDVDFGFMLNAVMAAATESYNRLASRASEQRQQVAEPRLKAP